VFGPFPNVPGVSWSESLLLVDEPDPANQTSGKNVVQGAQGANQVVWSGVPIDPPGTTGSRTLRLTNIRVNATQVAPGGKITADLFMRNFTGVQVPITNPQPT